jgi:hypothetical protein
MWTPTGAVLIDPAVHGGHRETAALVGAATSNRSNVRLAPYAITSAHDTPPSAAESHCSQRLRARRSPAAR